MLVDGRHRERRHDDHEDEEVVDAQAVLGDVAGEELPRVLAAGEDQDPEPEEHREDDVERHPLGGLADPDRVRVVVDDEEVDREQHENAGERGEPEPGGNVHDPPPDGLHRSLPEVSPAARAAGGTGSSRADPGRTVVTMPPRRDTPLHDFGPVSPIPACRHSRARFSSVGRATVRGMYRKIQVVFDCADPQVMTAFWGPTLGYVPEEPPPATGSAGGAGAAGPAGRRRVLPASTGGGAVIRPVHFEIHATDPEGAARFYREVLGWSIEQWGDQPYWIITTGKTDEPGINGGLLPRRGPPPERGAAVNAFVLTHAVDDIDATLAAAEQHGATIALPKDRMPGVGLLAYLHDPDGNLLGLLQPEPPG